MVYFLTPTGGGVGFVEPSLVPVWEVDAVVLLFSMLTLAHAIKNQGKALWFAALLGGTIQEQVSIRTAGTHCHHSGFVDISICSSGNSVLVYAPWVYSTIWGAKRMVLGPASNACIATLSWSSRFSFAAWSGLLSGLLFWPYEMQGPIAKLWRWPAEDGVILPKDFVKDFPFARANDPSKGLSAIPEVVGDLGFSTQVYGFPIHAILWDMANGFGVGASIALLPSFPYAFHTVVLGPILMVLKIRVAIVLAKLFETTVFVADPCLMAVTAVYALSSSKSSTVHSSTEENGIPAVGPGQRDWLLASGCFSWILYWLTLQWRELASFPGALKIIVAAIALAGVWVWKLAAVGNSSRLVGDHAKQA